KATTQSEISDPALKEIHRCRRTPVRSGSAFTPYLFSQEDERLVDLELQQCGACGGRTLTWAASVEHCNVFSCAKQCVNHHSAGHAGAYDCDIHYQVLGERRS
ncbi:MAG TPA: hypothetical protein VK642_01640, partial [Burkholderiales bacterium]|nr:hypothetical protein [Burkholderiales bacterium]